MAGHFNNYSEKNLDNPFSSDLSKQRDHKCCIERNKSKILLGFWKTVLSNQENDNGSSDSPSQDAFLWGVGSKCFYLLHFFKYFIRFIKQISFIKKKCVQVLFYLFNFVWREALLSLYNFCRPHNISLVLGRVRVRCQERNCDSF